jgi:heptosyltransferase-2
MATASFARLRAGFPDAEIVCGLRPYLRSLLDGSDYFDAFFDVSSGGGARGLWRQARELRRSRFDLALVFPNSLRSGLLVSLAGIPRRVGDRHGRGLLVNAGPRAERRRGQWGKRGLRRVPAPMPSYYHDILDHLGLPPGGQRGRLVVTAEERREIDAWLSARGVAPYEPLVVLNAGASYGSSKLWEPERFAAVARHFRERGATVLLLAGPAEVEMVRGIARASGALAAIDPVQRVGMLKPTLERAALLVTTDSGPRHVAVAFDVPVVCLMGPNDRRYTDYCLEKTALIRKDLECSPCQRKVCPLGHHLCMRSIEIDEVVRAGEDLMRRFPRPLAAT